MLTFRPSEEARRLGKWLYIMGAITVGLESFGIKLESSERFPVKFPDGFPLAGVSALVMLFFLVSFTARLVDEFAAHLYAKAVLENNVEAESPIELQDVTKFRPDRKHKGRLIILDHMPTIRKCASWLILVLDIWLPLVFSIYVLLHSCDNIANLLNSFN